MRIIAGRFKRHALKSPPGDTARPTTDRTRESMFNLIVHRMQMDGACVLDLFAGSGALGIEAVSRGAGETTFVESDRRVMRILQENALAMDPDQPWRFVERDALKFLRKEQESTWDLILADPPYHAGGLDRLPDLVLPRLADDGLFVLEHDRRVHFDEHPALEETRTYGRTSVSIFRTASISPDRS
ncbi:MAG: 16S rRNA (guanine(966)-N(2))-methyltransferase RsmD [Rhodothermales bacterium]|nr:16S rRNA (guanine(966)-N(2))-methyltransferase RsmD [Rhodothermales bacterium]